MGRSPCCDKTKVKKGPWSAEEDALLINFMANFGNGGNWISLPKKAGLNRCGKSCRLRWMNYLRPDVKHGDFTKDEDYTIYTLYNTIGSRWSMIASNLPGRTDNEVKNYWNTKLKKKISSGKFDSINKNNGSGISSNINTDCSTLSWQTLGNEEVFMNSELGISKDDQFMLLCDQIGQNNSVNCMEDGGEKNNQIKCYTSNSSSSVTPEISSSSSSVDINQGSVDSIAFNGEDDEFWMDLLSDSFEDDDDDDVVFGSQLDEKINEIASVLYDSFDY